VTDGAARADYMDAIVDLADERGYEALTVEEIALRAGGSAADFESTFDSKQACAIAALEEISAIHLAVVREAFASEERWPDSLRAAAYAHVAWIREHPRKMRFGMLEMLWASELTSAIRDGLIGEYIAMIDAGRAVAANPESVLPLTAEGVIGAIAQVMARNGARVEEIDLVAAVPEMMYLAVRPYLGEEAARRELTIPPPTD